MTQLASEQLTPLELDLLRRFHFRYGALGFPSPKDLKVASRLSSSAGRYVYLSHPGSVSIADGQLGLGGYSQINLAGLDAGASFWAEIEQGKVIYLEIAVNGEHPWDGSEAAWSVCDPETGIFSNGS